MKKITTTKGMTWLREKKACKQKWRPLIIIIPPTDVGDNGLWG